MVRSLSDPIHFSDLKKFALSPAHFRASCAESFASTRDMRVGTVGHHIVLGPHRTKPLVLFKGPVRKGAVWDAFAADNAGAEIVTQPEWDDAVPLAEAVMRDPVASALLKGTRREVALEWTDGGIKCATDGIDVVGDGFIADLKFTSCTEPVGFSRHSAKLLYHAQMAWLETAAQENGIDTSKGLFLIGTETSPPYAVTVMRLPPRTVEQGRKSYTLWLEKYRACVENDHWPAYTQTVVDFDLPPWMDGGEEEG